MADVILSNLVASISELKKHPMHVIKQSERGVVGILNNNKVVFYCIHPDLFEKLMDYVEDMEFAKIAESRANEETIEVNINDL